MANKKTGKNVAVLAIFLFVAIMAIGDFGGLFSMIGNMPFHSTGSQFTCPDTYWSKTVSSCNVRFTDTKPITDMGKYVTKASPYAYITAGGVQQQKIDLSKYGTVGNEQMLTSNWFIISPKTTISAYGWNADQGKSYPFTMNEWIVEYIEADQTCSPNWITEAWQSCQGRYKYRNVYDGNNCGITVGKPDNKAECPYDPATGTPITPPVTPPTQPPVTPPCVPEWKATGIASECVLTSQSTGAGLNNGFQSISMNDGCNNNKEESQSCTMPEVITPPADNGTGAGMTDVEKLQYCKDKGFTGYDAPTNTCTKGAGAGNGSDDFVSKYKYWIVGAILFIFAWAAGLITLISRRK